MLSVIQGGVLSQNIKVCGNYNYLGLLLFHQATCIYYWLAVAFPVKCAHQLDFSLDTLALFQRQSDDILTMLPQGSYRLVVYGQSTNEANDTGQVPLYQAELLINASECNE